MLHMRRKINKEREILCLGEVVINYVCGWMEASVSELPHTTNLSSRIKEEK